MLNVNQFSQSTQQGLLDLRHNANSVSGQVDSSSTDLIAGQAVKMIDSDSGIPCFAACTSDADDVFGFVNYDYKKNTHTAGEKIEVSCLRGNVMYMTASAPIARNGKVMIVVAGSKVATATTGKTVVGRAFDKASSADQLIRVVIDLPGSTL